MARKELPSGLAELIKSLGGPNGRGEDDIDDFGNTLSASKLFGLLATASSLYVSGNPFRVGDRVTVREGNNLRGRGIPLIVVDVTPSGSYANPLAWYNGGTDTDDANLVNGDAGNGRPHHDVRCITVRNNEITPVWFEHWQLRHWTPEDAERLSKALPETAEEE